MSQYKFSILVPSRNRLQETRRLINSINTTTVNKKEIEILFIFDEDDGSSVDNLMNIKKDYLDLEIKYYKRCRSEFSNRDYYNYLSKFSNGDFIWCCANDLVFLEKKWDIIFLNKINNFLAKKKDKIVCISILDDTPAPGTPPDDKKKYPSFPMFSKETFKFLGYILPSHVPTWGAERIIYEIYSKIDRMLFIHDKCYLHHKGYHSNFKNIEPDELTIRMGEIFAKYANMDIKHRADPKSPYQRIYIKEEIRKLRKYIIGLV